MRPNNLQAKTFSNTKVELDGQQFFNCTFGQCVMSYGGGAPPTLNGCTLGGCRWIFTGAADRTLQFMQAMYSGGFQDVVEPTFEAIRKGSLTTGANLNETPLDHAAAPSRLSEGGFVRPPKCGASSRTE